MKKIKQRHCGYAMKHPYIRKGARGSFQSLKIYWYCGQCERIFHEIDEKIEVIDSPKRLIMELEKRLDEIKTDLINLKIDIGVN